MTELRNLMQDIADERVILAVQTAEAIAADSSDYRVSAGRARTGDYRAAARAAQELVVQLGSALAAATEAATLYRVLAEDKTDWMMGRPEPLS